MLVQNVVSRLGVDIHREVLILIWMSTQQVAGYFMEVVIHENDIATRVAIIC